MENKFLATIVTSMLFAGGFALANTALAYPGTSTGGYDDDTSTTGFMDDKSLFGNTTTAVDNGTKIMGMITSIQNNEQGRPAWLVGGHWELSYTPDDTGTAATGSNLTATTNSLMSATGNDTTTAASYGNITDFNAMLHMVMLDGSGMHPHEISNFIQLEEAATVGNSTTIIGTSTVTMREGPVHDVATQITISQDEVIEIDLDPVALENHFGDTPIYGIVMDDMMTGMAHKMGGTMTSGMEDRHMNVSNWQDGNTTASMTEDMWE